MLEHDNPYQSPEAPIEPPPPRRQASWLWNLMLPAIMLPLGYIGIQIGNHRDDPEYLRMAWIFGFQFVGIILWAIVYRVTHRGQLSGENASVPSA